MKSRLVPRLVAFVAVGAILAWVLSRLDWRELGARFAEASPEGIAAMTAVWIFALLLRPLRFWYLLTVLGGVRGARYRTIWTAMVLGMAVNSFAPMRAGDAVMAIFLRHRLNIEIHRSFTVIVADWLCDFICVVVIFVSALAFAPPIAAWIGHASMVVVAVGAAGLTGLSLILRYRSQFLAIVDRWLARLLPKHRVRLHSIAAEILAGLTMIGRWRVSIPLVSISAVIWLVTACSYWFGMQAVFNDAPSAAAPFTMAAVALSFVLPLGPGGLGAFEAAVVVALAVFEVPVEASVAFAVIAHGVQLGTVLLFTGLAVVTQRVDYRLLWAATEKR
ncbi:MAG: flippase-like domain-containing protein [Enhydrobacter sp.]|nr:MAG: flippase-like domain-containing protein [Enhydrobacter sp.]